MVSKSTKKLGKLRQYDIILSIPWKSPIIVAINHQFKEKAEFIKVFHAINHQKGRAEFIKDLCLT